jgi:hypothetical protein
VVDRQTVDAWLERYVRAWETYDSGLIGDLFSEDARYRYHPSDEPVVGREAIVASWLAPDADSAASGRDEPGTYAAHYEAWAVDGDRAVAVGWSRYWTDATRAVERQVYENCYLLEFDADARCRSFTELFMKRPAG